ncbi:polyphosphate kinase 1 [Rubripirellula sp.]|nr:polyphosphate kinase 1 [Rubripirellula sp.]MDB4338560.1 polyphosphate kinase 1 [Rubripirellula sp.]
MKKTLNKNDTQQNPKPHELIGNHFINREISWLEFNTRVLDQADDSTLPLLERAKFLAITSSNLDEFMMVRIGSLKLQHDQNSPVRDPSGKSVGEQLQAVTDVCKKLVKRQTEIYTKAIEILLSDSGIHRISLGECNERCRHAADRQFNDYILPILSPQIINEAHPFPMVQGLGLHLCVRIRKTKSETKDLASQQEEITCEKFDYAVIPIGKSLNRMLAMPSDNGHWYLLIEELVEFHITQFFPGREILECVPFRITRNADIELREDSAADLTVGMEEVLESRKQSRPVRLEFRQGASDEMLQFLSERLNLTSQDLYPTDGPLDLTYLFGVHSLKGFDDLRDTPWPGQQNPNIDPADSMFANIARQDLLLVHPYESFDPIVRLIEEAAVDANVLAIKQVLYRTSRDSPIVSALQRAAQNGKYVSVIVELKARFDEARNIEWAKEMEQSGVQVIYGIRGLKTHAKICIIVRRESQGIVRYMHFGTGNYNEVTANIYSDVSLLTCKDDLGAEATSFFNAITGASELKHLQRISAAPDSLRNRILNLIEQEITRCEQGQRAEIIAKINALVDPKVIEAFYRASQAGVKIQLNVRGVCCLKPGVPGLSENIQIVSIIDRFLEHARILYFRHGGSAQVFISSADWMPRNLDRRVELLIPIDDHKCQEKLINTLQSYFKDRTNAWVMQPDGSYQRIRKANKTFRSQKHLYETAKQAMVDKRQARHAHFEPHRPK